MGYLIALTLLGGGLCSGFLAGWVVGRFGHIPKSSNPSDYIAVELARTNRMEITNGRM